MRSVRINFSKSGKAIFISHLDVNRMMTRAVRRAKLPMWYTEGFNPHPYIAFALPLSLGQSSDCEYMDIRIEGEMQNDEIKEKLNAVLPDGVKIISVSNPVYDPKEIDKAQYFVKAVFENDADAQAFIENAEKLVAGEEIMAEKLGKKGHHKVMKQINLIDYIFETKFSKSDSIVNLQTVLAAGNTNNLNQTLLMETIENSAKVNYNQLYVVRKRLITKNNENFR